jgi:hypothetical protein
MKLFHTLALSAVLGLGATASYGQDCNLDIDEVDQFSKNHLKSGTSKIGNLMWHWNLTLKKDGNVYGWEMKIVLGGHIPEPIRKGDIIYCKLDNDKVVQLIADNDYAPVHAVNGSNIISQFVPKGTLDEAAIKTFSEAPLSEMRVTLSGNKVEPPISGKQGKSIQTTARCLLLP